MGIRKLRQSAGLVLMFQAKIIRWNCLQVSMQRLYIGLRYMKVCETICSRNLQEQVREVSYSESRGEAYKIVRMIQKPCPTGGDIVIGVGGSMGTIRDSVIAGLEDLVGDLGVAGIVDVTISLPVVFNSFPLL
ncbi:hypothetical protein GOBAR_DD04164 [Gossypium barbadense]|nr:hypothetical protein GOBAR_DD04164 [Gossypium barbadense]